MERFSLGYNIEAWRCLAKDKTFHAYDAPTSPAPADAKCNAPGCSVCAAGLPHTTHSYPMTAPAPADDAREKGLAAYDALNMREKSEIAAQHPRYCYAKGYVAALAGRADDATRGCTVAFCETHRDVEIVPGPFCPACLGSTCRVDGMRDGLRARRADDASGAEAMREAWAYAIVNAQGKRTGVIHADRSLLGPIVEADNDDDLAGGPFRIVPLYAAPLPAPGESASQDAVVEAARALDDAARRFRHVAADDYSIALAGAWAVEAEMAAAALRREKGAP